MSVRSHISKTTLLQTSRNFLYILVNYGRGSVLHRRQCNMFCTSGFVDNVMFSQNGANWAESIRRCYVWSSSPGGRAERTGTKSTISNCLILIWGTNLNFSTSVLWSLYGLYCIFNRSRQMFAVKISPISIDFRCFENRDNDFFLLRIFLNPKDPLWRIFCKMSLPNVITKDSDEAIMSHKMHNVSIICYKQCVASIQPINHLTL